MTVIASIVEGSNGLLIDADGIGTHSSWQAKKLNPTPPQTAHSQEANLISILSLCI